MGKSVRGEGATTVRVRRRNDSFRVADYRPRFVRNANDREQDREQDRLESYKRAARVSFYGKLRQELGEEVTLCSTLALWAFEAGWDAARCGGTKTDGFLVWKDPRRTDRAIQLALAFFQDALRRQLPQLRAALNGSQA